MSSKILKTYWIGDEPAWDIELSNGIIHNDVTKGKIQLALNAMERKGLIPSIDAHIDVVRLIHIMHYDDYHCNIKGKG